MAEIIEKTRKVRDSAYWGAPVGTPITPAMKEAKRAQQAAKGKAKGDAAARAAGGGSGGGARGGASPSAPASASFKRNDEYQKRLAKIDRMIANAKSEQDLVRVVEEIEGDSLLDDKDYNRALDNIEAKFNGKPVKPLAQANAPRPAKKAAAKRPEPKAPPARPAKKAVPRKQVERGDMKGADGRPILPPKPSDRTPPAKKAPAKKAPGAIRQAAAQQAASPGVQPSAGASRNQRAAARNIGRSQVPTTQKDFEARVDQAVNEADLIRIAQEIDAHPDLDVTAKDNLFDAISAKAKSLRSTPKKRSTPKGKYRRPRGAHPTPWAQDDAGIARQAEHFGNGGSIADAPDAGLWNYILSDTERFEVTPNGEAGVSANFWVVDHDTGEKWMFKRAFFDGHGGGPNAEDILNEQVAAGIFEGAGFRQTPTRRASHGAPSDQQWMAQRHWGEEFSPQSDIMDPYDVLEMNGFDYNLRYEVIEGLRDGPDPSATARMMVFDYLINNQIDRHGKNFLVIDHGNGEMEMGVIDQGLAFSGPEVAARRPGGHRQMDFRRFFADYRGNDWSIANVIGVCADGDRDTLAQHLQEAIDGFLRVNRKDLAQQMRGQGIDANRQDYVDEWLDEYEWRLDWFQRNMDSVVRLIMARSGV